MTPYNFDQQKKKGDFYEQHFYEYLTEKKQNPFYNNKNGNDKEYDIIANEKKYEVKLDCYDNNKFPIEISHIYMDLTVKEGWLYFTESDFIVFYKEQLKLRYYLSTKKLKEFIKKNLLTLHTIKMTRNETKITWNAYLTDYELEKAGILIQIEPF
jgi:hypothetical protein